MDSVAILELGYCIFTQITYHGPTILKIHVFNECTGLNIHMYIHVIVHVCVEHLLCTHKHIHACDERIVLLCTLLQQHNLLKGGLSS